MPDADPERVLEQLAALPLLTPDPLRAAHVRARCLSRLARGRREPEHVAGTPGFGRRVLAPAIVLVLCALYLASLVSTALHLRAFF